MSDTIPSPCQQRCQLDDAGESCLSCRRTLKEIAGWPGFSDFEKKAVWSRLLALPPQGQCKQCPACGDSFTCRAGDAAEECWCARLPHIMPLGPEGSGCLCPACLLQAMATQPPAADGQG